MLTPKSARPKTPKRQISRVSSRSPAAAPGAVDAEASPPSTSSTGRSEHRQGGDGGGPQTSDAEESAGSSPETDRRGGGDGGGKSAGGSKRKAKRQRKAAAASGSASDSEEEDDFVLRLSRPQLAWVAEVQRKVNAGIVHFKGKVVEKEEGGFPFNGGWAVPPLASRQKVSSLPSVDPFFLKKVFVWVPEFIFPGVHIPCPTCGGKASSDGWNPKQPRRVFLEEDIGYTCSNCSAWNRSNNLRKGDKKRRKASFNAWDQGVLGRLESYVSSELPFILSKRSGVAKSLVARLADDLLNGKGFSATSKFIREAYLNTCMTKHHSYVSLVNRYRESIVEQLRGASGEGVADIPTFGDFDDRQGFNGATPSDTYLRAVDGMRMTREDYVQRVGQLVDGMILAGDASFKYAKVIRLTSAQQSKTNKPIQGIFILNEYEQVVSVHDFKNDLKNLFINRYKAHGFKLPVLLFSDDCCKDRAMYLAMFREIQQATGVCLYDATEAGGAELEELEFPEGRKPSVVWADTVIELAVADLLRGCEEQGNLLGMDCEWEPPFDGTSERPVCTLQLALPDGTAYLLHLRRGERCTTSSSFPSSLKGLLGDPDISKVGVAIKGDANRLLRDYDVETRGIVDLTGHARSCWVALPSRSLAGMTAAALGKSLSTDPAVRFSTWSKPELTKKQIDYACLDAYAGVLLYAEIAKFKDPIFSEAPRGVPPAGTETGESESSQDAAARAREIEIEELVKVQQVISDKTKTGKQGRCSTAIERRRDKARPE